MWDKPISYPRFRYILLREYLGNLERKVANDIRKNKYFRAREFYNQRSLKELSYFPWTWLICLHTNVPYLLRVFWLPPPTPDPVSTLLHPAMCPGGLTCGLITGLPCPGFPVGYWPEGGTSRRSGTQVIVKLGYSSPTLPSCGDKVDCLDPNTVSHIAPVPYWGPSLHSPLFPWKPLLLIASSGLGRVRGGLLWLAPDATLFLPSPYPGHISEESLSHKLSSYFIIWVCHYFLPGLGYVYERASGCPLSGPFFRVAIATGIT